jgi:hypothetical protein
VAISEFPPIIEIATSPFHRRTPRDDRIDTIPIFQIVLYFGDLNLFRIWDLVLGISESFVEGGLKNMLD